MIKLRVKEGPNARDQIAFYAHHSFLVEVQTNAGYSLDPRALLQMMAMEGCTGFEIIMMVINPCSPTRI